MKSIGPSTLFLVTVLLLPAGTAQAAGFNIYEAGARATALGGAFTATADDASALFYNPAGLAFLYGTRVDLNWMPIIPGAEFKGARRPTQPQPPFEGKTVDQSFSIPGIYLGHKMNERWGVGVGLYAPFGLGVEWEDPDSWIGRFTSYDVDLATVYVTTAASYLLRPDLSLALGVDIAWQRIELNRRAFATPPPDFDIVDVIDTQLKGDSDLNLTPCAGLLYKPTPKLSVGVMYHHKKTMKYEDGDGLLTNVVPTSEPGLRAAIDAQIVALGGTDNSLSTEIRLPYILALGASYQLHPRARFEFDAVRFGWSHFDYIDLVFENDPLEQLSQRIVEEYEDVWQLRFGLELVAARSWNLMLGYIRDNSPQPIESMGPLLPDADRNDFSIGVQHRYRNWTFTGSYMAVLFEERSTVQDGEVAIFEDATPEEINLRTLEAGSYDSTANILGFGVGYEF